MKLSGASFSIVVFGKARRQIPSMSLSTRRLFRARWRRIKPASPATRDSLEIVLMRDYKIDDGRFSNNGWLQELPDPVSKITWDNAVVISRKTAKDLGVKNFDVVEVKRENRVIAGPIWIQPGMADNTLGLALGYGRSRAGRVGSQVGFNAYALRTGGDSPDLIDGASVRSLGRTFELSTTQHHWSMEGRPIVREANLDQYHKHPDFAKADEAGAAAVDAAALSQSI